MRKIFTWIEEFPLSWYPGPSLSYPGWARPCSLAGLCTEAQNTRFLCNNKAIFLYINDYIKTIHVPLPRKSPIFVNPITHRRTGPFFLISRRPIPENSFWHPNFLNFILRLCAPMKTKSPTLRFTLSQGTFGIHSTWTIWMSYLLAKEILDNFKTYVCIKNSFDTLSFWIIGHGKNIIKNLSL